MSLAGATLIFALTYLFIVSERTHRTVAALLGAAAAYIVAAAAVRIINAILIQAMIDDEMNKEQTGDARS